MLPILCFPAQHVDNMALSDMNWTCLVYVGFLPIMRLSYLCIIPN